MELSSMVMSRICCPCPATSAASSPNTLIRCKTSSSSSKMVVVKSSTSSLNLRGQNSAGHWKLDPRHQLEVIKSQDVAARRCDPRNQRLKDDELVSSSWKRGVRVGAHLLSGRPLVVGLGGELRRSVSNGSRWSAATWLDNRAQVEVEVSLSEAWELWNDRENVTRWMEWISSVKVSKEKPVFSKWTFSYNALGQYFEFSWLARNLQPIYHQKIHWRSVDGLPNRGAVRFFPRGPSSCTVELTISYEVPDILGPFATTLSPLVERILAQDMQRFAKFAKSNCLTV